MTKTEAVELLWKVKVDGEAQIASMERATRGANGAVVEGASALKAFDGAGRTTNRTIEELRGQFASLRSTAAGAASQVAESLGPKLSGQVASTTAEVGKLDGAFRVALGTDIVLRWVGVAASMIEVLAQVHNEWDPVIRAQREALKVIQDLRREYAQLEGEQGKLLLSRVERREGRSGRLRRRTSSR